MTCASVRASVSTTITQTFACERIGNKYFLRAEPTLACESSSARYQGWKKYSILMLLLYPFGFPLLLLCLLLPQRARIRELMSEVHRQSLIAARPVALHELSEVQRDSNYEETMLIVKCKHGKEALMAFNRERRLPALFGGTLLILAGVALVMSPVIFEAPVVYASLGVVVGFLPGVTLSGLAIQPGDDRVIKRLFVAMLLIGAGYGCSYVIKIKALLTPIFDGGDRECVDFRSVSAPCWLSAIHVAMYFANMLVCFEVVVRRTVVTLYTARNVGSRFTLMWSLWARWLIAFAATASVFLAPYLTFAQGLAFLRSPEGAVYIVEAIMMAALGIGSYKKWHIGLQTWLSTFGTVTHAMVVATLMSQGGDKPLEEVMANAKDKLRYVTLSSMSVSDFEVSGGGRSQEKYSKSVHCRPRDIDVFVTHSWSDPPLEKWESLKKYCDDFSKKHNREAWLWVDLFCLDPDVPSEPQYHPVYMMSAERLVVLKGPTFKEKLWCACELLIWVEVGGSTSSIDILPFAGCTLSVDDDNWVDVRAASPTSAFQLAVLEVIRACGSAAKFGRRVSDILDAVSVQLEQSRHTGAPATDVAVRVRSRRLSTTILLTQELGHLFRQFEKMRPGYWWINLFLLIVRLSSTSLVALLNNQANQVHGTIAILTATKHEPLTFHVFHRRR